MIEKRDTLNGGIAQRSANPSQQAAAEQSDSIERPSGDWSRTDVIHRGYYGMTPAGMSNDSTQRLMAYKPAPILNALDTASGWRTPNAENPFRTRVPLSGINTGRPVRWQRINHIT